MWKFKNNFQLSIQLLNACLFTEIRLANQRISKIIQYGKKMENN